MPPLEFYAEFISFQEAVLKKICWPMCLLAVLAVVCGPGAARADSVVGPFVDSQTNAVIYVNFSTLDMDWVAPGSRKPSPRSPIRPLAPRNSRWRSKESSRRKNGFPISKPPAGRICTSSSHWAG